MASILKCQGIVQRLAENNPSSREFTSEIGQGSPSDTTRGIHNPLRNLWATRKGVSLDHNKVASVIYSAFSGVDLNQVFSDDASRNGFKSKLAVLHSRYQKETGYDSSFLSTTIKRIEDHVFPEPDLSDQNQEIIEDISRNCLLESVIPTGHAESSQQAGKVYSMVNCWCSKISHDLLKEVDGRSQPSKLTQEERKDLHREFQWRLQGAIFSYNMKVLERGIPSYRERFEKFHEVLDMIPEVGHKETLNGVMKTFPFGERAVQMIHTKLNQVENKEVLQTQLPSYSKYLMHKMQVPNVEGTHTLREIMKMEVLTPDQISCIRGIIENIENPSVPQKIEDTSSTHASNNSGATQPVLQNASVRPGAETRERARLFRICNNKDNSNDDILREVFKIPFNKPVTRPELKRPMMDLLLKYHPDKNPACSKEVLDQAQVITAAIKGAYDNR